LSKSLVGMLASLKTLAMFVGGKWFIKEYGGGGGGSGVGRVKPKP